MNNTNDENLNKLKARLLLALQEEDDNPYDVSDEMLVAFAEGKLSAREAAVIHQCLAHNADAQSAYVLLCKNRQAENLDESVHSSLIQKIARWINQHKTLSAAGVGSTLASAMAVVLLFSATIYDDLDSEFTYFSQRPDKPAVSWGRGETTEREDASLLQMKGAENDFLLQGYYRGLIDGLGEFASLTEIQRQQIDRSPPLSPHCNNVLSLQRCHEVLKQGRYLGKWLAMHYVQCQSENNVTPKKNLAETVRSLIADISLDEAHPLGMSLSQLETAPQDKACGIIIAMVNAVSSP